MVMPLNSNDRVYEDGYLKIEGINIYFKRFGKGNKHKLIALHGGPGASHDYLIPLGELADRDFDVLLYDQFGSGNSDYPLSEGDYTLEHGVEEVEEIRSKFYGDDKINLLGHSYGGMLALAYALKYQNHLKTLISSSGVASVKDTVEEMHMLISGLPEPHRGALINGERTGNYQSEEFKVAYDYFMKRHVLRASTYPPEVARTLEMVDKRGTYLKMNGPSEFMITGTIRNVEILGELHRIKVPTLITCGQYDEVTPEIGEGIHREIEGSEFMTFPDSSHFHMWEQRGNYLNTVEEFVKRNDR